LNRTRWTVLVVVAGWLATMLLVAAGMQAARRWALADLGTAGARQNWQEYKRAVTAQGRRPPKSDEPPTLILLRDRFAGVLVSTLVLATSLYAFLALVLLGMWRGADRPRARSPLTAAAQEPTILSKRR
jgi:hypothetical protein